MVLAIVAWIAQLALAQSPTGNAVVLQLQTYGWEPPGPHEIDGPSIVIDHQNRVLIGFTVRQRNGLVTRNQPSLSFHIVRFLPDGKLDMSLSLPTNAAGRTAIYLSDTDQIVARANSSIQLLKADDRNPQGGTWKILAPCGERCLVMQSHSRHTLHLYTEAGDPPVTLIHLSPQPVLQRCGQAQQVIKSNEDSIQNYPQAITDEFAYFSETFSTKEHSAYRWPLCDYEHRVELPVHIYGRWTVLNDNIFIANPHNASKDRSGLEVISAGGQVKFRWGMEKHETADTFLPIRSSERGDRIAIDVPTLRGGNRTLDISDHVISRRIAVYDIEVGKEIASIRANPKYRYSFAFDLSPDGRKLAVLEDDVLRVVDLEGAAKTNVP